jgi:antitoxin (DNA-binding transcriptional repressor) of toxin-antitoxin stability system
MRVVGIKVLKNRLSEYLKLVGEGETVLITDRDRVVAELRAPDGRGPQVADAVLAGLVREGLMTPAAAPGGAAPVAGKADMTLEQILRALDDQRLTRAAEALAIPLYNL